MGFQLHTAIRTDLLPQVDSIAQSYFTLDTATPQTANAWYQKNPSCLIIASLGDVVHGYADFLPLTSEAKQLIEENRLKEEDIGPQHILHPDAMKHCRAVYFAGIAVRDRKSFLGVRCAAALIAGCAQMIETLYNHDKLEFFYTNPTTYTGNRLVRRIGLEPAQHERRNINGMDLYRMKMDDAAHQKLQGLHQRYKPFIASMDFTGKQ